MKYLFSGLLYFVFLLCKQILNWLPSFFWIKTKLTPPKTVPYVDLSRYAGKWYEIASIPQSYSEGCVGTTVTFGKLRNGEISTIVRYYEGDFNGPIQERKGTCKVVDKKTNAKLEVKFIWPFSSDFWILDLEDKYQYSSIGEPDRSSLWILSRTSTMSDELYNGIIKRMKGQQYDTSRLRKTPQKQEEKSTP